MTKIKELLSVLGPDNADRYDLFGLQYSKPTRYLKIGGYTNSKGEKKDYHLILVPYPNLVVESLQDLGQQKIEIGEHESKMIDRMLRFMDPRVPYADRATPYDQTPSPWSEFNLYPSVKDQGVWYLVGWTDLEPETPKTPTGTPEGVPIDRYVPMLKLEEGKFDYAQILPRN